MRRRIGLVLLLAVVGLVRPVLADPYTCDAATGCTWQTGYVEPATLTNGQPITDLVNCTATYTTAVDGGAPGPAKTFTIAASRPTGGQAVTKNNTDATMAPPHSYLISETVKCTSATMGTSAPSPSAILLMNNGVTPAATGAPTLQ